MQHEVKINGLMMDPTTNMPVVVLKCVDSDAVMPIWVGIFEANAIGSEFEKSTPPRPMTHDLIRSLIRHLNCDLERVVISKLNGDMFLAQMWIRQGEEQVVIDLRPSDGIALAMRCECPIYVADEVLQAARISADVRSGDATKETAKGWLEGLNDDDFGRYKM